jgi:hypothetical protein
VYSLSQESLCPKQLVQLQGTMQTVNIGLWQDWQSFTYYTKARSQPAFIHYNDKPDNNDDYDDDDDDDDDKTEWQENQLKYSDSIKDGSTSYNQCSALYTERKMIS